MNLHANKHSFELITSRCMNKFVSGPNPKIERADMDGNRRKSVIVDQIFWPNGLTIDYTESRIYWADAKHHVIEKATFDGRDRKRVRI